MNDMTCVIIGGGHVGLHSLKAIKEQTQGKANGRRIRFVLIDKRPGHMRKMLLFRPAVGQEEIMIPWTHYSFSEGVEFVQGKVTSVDSGENRFNMRIRKVIMPACSMTFWSWRSATSFGNRNPAGAASP
ncbi:hypothetical protein LJK87_41495 [Paenibacillus sp. P25]|nr:hypothetical protein LJK87_41495 [Paenibacillus sp. P25]